MKHVRRAPNVKPNSWGIRKIKNRNIRGVMLHETRSGRPEIEDGSSAENWFGSRDNARPTKRNPTWCSMTEVLIWEMGDQVIYTDHANEYAAWTAGWGAKGDNTWPAGMSYIQIEIAHGTGIEPYNATQLDSIAQLVAEYSITYDFPLTRIPFLYQTEDPKPRGITTHKDSANGKKLGKTDPGTAFPWDKFFTLTRNYVNPKKELTLEERMDNVESYLAALNESQWAHKAGRAREQHNQERP